MRYLFLGDTHGDLMAGLTDTEVFSRLLCALELIDPKKASEFK